MNIDLHDIRCRIVDGIYGDDRMTKQERDDAFSALAVLIAEMERLRVINADLRFMVDGLETAAHEERAAVVAWLRDCALDPETTGAEMRLFQNQATTIERGDHRREEKP